MDPEVSASCKRAVSRVILLLVILASAIVPARAQTNDPPSISDAIRFFAHEKSAAEQYGVILATIGKNDIPLYLQGIKLYADAKAEFDGLLAELRFDLQSGQEPTASVKLHEAMTAAAEKRVAFTSFVSNEIAKMQGARPGLPNVIEVVPELVKALTEAGLSVWKAFHQAGAERRTAILNELEQLKWQSFAALAK